MEAGLSAWQQITRCLFIVAFTDKHSSFPLCPAECTHNISSIMELVLEKLTKKVISKESFQLKYSSTKEQIRKPHKKQTKQKKEP
jgi:hypothetical protein